MAWAYVRDNISENDNGVSGAGWTTGTATASSTAGNMLVFFCSVERNQHLTGVTDSAGNNYTKAVTQGTLFWWTSEIWYCANAAAVSSGSTTWTTTAGGSGASSTAVMVREYSGGGSTPTVSTSGQQDESSSVGTTTVNTAGSATANDLVLTCSSNQNSSTKTPDGSYSHNAGPTGTPVMKTADKLAAGGSDSCTWTWSPSSDGSSAIACFTASGGGGFTAKNRRTVSARVGSRSAA